MRGRLKHRPALPERLRQKCDSECVYLAIAVAAHLYTRRSRPRLDASWARRVAYPVAWTLQSSTGSDRWRGRASCPDGTTAPHSVASLHLFTPRRRLYHGTYGTSYVWQHESRSLRDLPRLLDFRRRLVGAPNAGGLRSAVIIYSLAGRHVLRQRRRVWQRPGGDVVRAVDDQHEGRPLARRDRREDRLRLALRSGRARLAPRAQARLFAAVHPADA